LWVLVARPKPQAMAPVLITRWWLYRSSTVRTPRR
jgi:hypothetical protein